MNKKKIIFSDPTLRDGSHAIKHQLTLDDIQIYAEAIDQVGIDIVEVGHGNGLGASSLQLGKAVYGDREMLKVARQALKRTKLGVHIIPGLGRIEPDLQTAIEEGVDVFRVASHCTEADTTARQIKFVKDAGRQAFGVLMMTHMASKEILLEESKKMQDYGAEAIVLMDSAGAYLVSDVKDKVGHLVSNLKIPVGFHAHNNLSMAVANSIAALESGATILDGTVAGFGAGAGNTPLEVLIAVLQKMGYPIDVDLYKLLDAVEVGKKSFIKQVPSITELSIISGLSGVFSGFALPVKKAAEMFGVDARDIFKVLGERNVVAGQEDLIIEVAKELQRKK
jgi:4-hydroxy 2-oxovalerate aldolase